jgi:hypothetical protein
VRIFYHAQALPTGEILHPGIVFDFRLRPRNRTHNFHQVKNCGTGDGRSLGAFDAAAEERPEDAVRADELVRRFKELKNKQ